MVSDLSVPWLLFVDVISVERFLGFGKLSFVQKLIGPNGR